MKKYLLFFSFLCCLSADLMAQPATYAMPFSIGRNNCGSSSGATTLYSFPGVTARSYDSTYFFDYVSPNLTRNTLRSAYYPRLRIGNGTYASSSPSMTARDRFTINAASVSFNPRDGKLYYLWTDYSAAISPTLKTYVWRWNPDTTFSTASFNNPVAGILLDTLASFAFDIGGITFDNSGNAWQLEFSNAPAPYKSRMRKIDFVTKVIDPIPDTLDLIPGAGGIGDTIYNVNSGDITLMPNGQMYYVFDNKLFTPDYGSYGGATHHISSTYIDTIRRPTGATNLVGLAYGNGDLISSFSPGCLYRRIDPITGDTNYVNYAYLAAKGVQSSDMSQISSGLGVAKKLVSVTTTGTAGQYNVVYDVLIKNYGTTPLTNLQVYDSLNFINGAANLSNVSTTMMTIPPPPGIALNGGFNGVTDARLLQFSGQNLPNYPVDSSSFTVRVSCRISNVLDGVVYNNSAVGYATGYKGVALRDSSTNGNAPDLNQNDKPDDLGEGQPTPFVIILTPTTPPCATLSQVLYTNTFGTGVGLSASLPAAPSTSTQYTGTATAPLGTNKFSTTNNAALGDPTNWISLTDHTGDVNGRMMVVNADAPAYVFYKDTLPVACPGQQYSMSFWTAFIGNSTYQTQCNALGGFKYPKFLIRMRDLVTGLTITQFTTANITSTSWQQLGMKWVMPAGYTNIIMELLNAGPGGCGNDFALDDVQYGICDPLPTVSASSSCFGGTATFTAALSDPTVIPGSKAYQWQVAPALAGPYANIIGANASTYTINPILASDTGKYYRVIIAAAGNIAIPSCQYISPGVKLTSAISSVGPSSISAPSTTYCNPGSVNLTAVGGTLGTSANYQWGTGAVVGTGPIAGATSSTLTVSPTVTTTYWVRIENTAGPCTSITGGTTVTITVIQPSAAPTSVTGPDICNGSSTTLTAVGGTLGTSANYQWGTGAVVGTSPIGGATSSTLTVSPTTTTTTYWVRIENTAGPCTATTSGLTKTITVSQPSVGPTSITAPSSTICNGSSIVLTAAGGTLGTSANYQWGTGAVVGSSPIGGATSSTLTVSPTTTTTYWVRIENTASPCTATTGGTTVTITVNQPSAAPSSVTGADICNGSSTTLTAVGGTLGTSANYQWGTGAVVGTSPIGGATSSTLTVSPTTTTTYWVRIENTSSPCTAITSGLTKIITVSQPSSAPTSVTGADICNGASTTLTAVGGTLGTSANYQWGTGAVVGTSPIGGATSSTLTVSPTVNTTYWVRIENTSSPCTAITGGLTKTITVSQPSAAPTSVTGADICNGSSTTLTAVGGTLGTSANYQWGTGAVVGTSPIGGATSSTLTVSPTTTTTYWVRIENTSSPCTAITSGLTKIITVSQPSAAPTSVTGADICNGSSTTLTAVGGTLGTAANYQWGTGAVVGTSPIGGATSSTLTVSPTVTTTYWVRIENTSSPCTAITGGLTKTITVSQPSAAPSSVTGADICNGSSTTLTAVGGTLGTSANYQWGTGAVVGTSPIGGATSSTLTVSPTTTTTYWVRIENTAGPCTATTGGLTKTITVSQPSAAPSSVTGADICNGSSTTLTAVGGTLGTSANYQWGTGAVVGTSPIGGATSSTLTVSPTTTTTYWVRIENTAGPCTATTGGLTKTITVSQPSAAPSSVTGANICNGSSTTLTAVGGTLGTSANYQWGTGAVVGTSPIGGATSSTLTVSPTTTTTYWVRIENTAGPCTATTSGLTKIITVSQPSAAPSNITGPDICNSGSTTLTAIGGTLGSSANYQWGTGSVVGTSPIAGATSSTLTVSPGSSTTYWVRIENTAGPCSPTTTGVTKLVTVNLSSIAPSSVTGADFCNPGSTTLTALGGTLGTSANYQWGTGAVVGTSPIGGATSSTLTVSPSSTTTYWVRIENTAGPCTAITGGVTKLITVSQPSVAATAAGRNKNNICPGISAKIYRTGGTLGTSATWKWYTGSPGGTLIGSADTLTVTPLVTTTYYLRAEGFCNTTAAQSVTIFISCDIDKDKDGIPDYIESNIAAATANGYNTSYPGYVDYNNDFINDNFQADGDSDNDGLPNYLDLDFPGRVDVNSDGIDDRFDTDLDGKINMLDLDSDNDGIPDVVEANGVDADGDGKIDNFTDTDGDGLSQNVDANNTGANNSSIGLGVINFDNDAVPNFLDMDSDNDGIPDVVEVGGPDTNNDGKIDGFVDANNDGLHDSYINATALLKTGADTNGDGRADSYPNKNLDRDFRPNAYDLDSDGDGIVDVIEAGLPDADFNGIVDGTIGSNGWSTTVSGLGSLGLRSTDADGKPDYLDIDADDDGIPDNIEGQTTFGYKLPTLIDADGDGLMNPYDNLPAAFGGSGIYVYDHDGDGTPDYRDLDTDADGLIDRIEGNDFNLNGLADDNVTLTGLDTDGDGLDNRFDSLNSVTNIKGTSYRMGASGSFTGDATPGSRTTVQRRYGPPTQVDRDWRFSGYILPVRFLNLTGVLQTDKVLVNWAIIADKEIDHFEVERSTDNHIYIKAGTVSQTVKLNVQQNFTFTDDIANINKEIFYYRIKVVGKGGEIQYSNILVIRRKLNKTALSIVPNPAKDNVSVTFYANAKCIVNIRMIDESGKLVLQQKNQAAKGNNTIQLTGLDKYSSGIYILQVYINEETVTQKLVLMK